MTLRERLAEDKQTFDAIVGVATCRGSVAFCDLLWPPLDSEVERRRLDDGRDAGVIFETARRMVVIEEHGGELRYYAGGWCLDGRRRHSEEDRIWAEGHETGVLPSPHDAVLFAERFLVREEAIQEIDTPRAVRYRQDTDKGQQPNRCP